MFDQKRFVFTIADVGHHSEVLNKIIYAWFNNAWDDVEEGPNASLQYVKVSMSQYGKPFLIGLLFYSGCLNKVVESSVKFKTEALTHLPLPQPGDGPRILNQTWPICAAVHLKTNPDIRMVEQLNEADTSLVSVFTPYKNVDEKVLQYCYDRHHHFEPDAEIDSTLDIDYNIQLHEQITNKHDLSFLYDIVHNTYHTLDELREITGVEPVTDEARLRNWFDIAHKVYKENFER